MIALPAFSWKLAMKIGTIVAVVVILWWIQARIRVSYQAEVERDQAIAAHELYKKAVEEQARRDAEQRAKDEAADQALSARVATLQGENEALRRALSRIPPVVESTDAQGRTVVRIAGDWWLCLGAQLTRDPADTAACQARASDAWLPNAIGH